MFVLAHASREESDSPPESGDIARGPTLLGSAFEEELNPPPLISVSSVLPWRSLSLVSLLVASKPAIVARV
jgi:hypothetical protein